MSQNPDDLFRLARSYCEAIESAELGNREWLGQVSGLLPSLHAAMAAGQAVEAVQQGPCPKIDLDARFELYIRLSQALGERDAYWMEYDVGQDENHKSGSLADDLTDIYCELKLGLRMLDERMPGEWVLAGWRRGFFLHWGKHLVDAERHLYELSAQNQLLIG